MYPAKVFSLFPPHPHEKRVFVAMPFSELFDPRWENVIAPAIESAGLEPYRVNISQVSDAIVDEIQRGIASDQLVFADITSENKTRNGNVMYEVGLAHAVRQPEEVLLFRSDSDDLIFDIAGIRVVNYKPDTEPSAAREQVASHVKRAIKEVDSSRSLAVERLVQAIDGVSYGYLLIALKGELKQAMATSLASVSFVQERNNSIIRLLQLGLLESQSAAITVDNFETELGRSVIDGIQYRPTALGRAVCISLCVRNVDRDLLEDERFAKFLKVGEHSQ